MSCTSVDPRPHFSHLQLFYCCSRFGLHQVGRLDVLDVQCRKILASISKAHTFFPGRVPWVRKAVRANISHSRAIPISVASYHGAMRRSCCQRGNRRFKYTVGAMGVAREENNCWLIVRHCVRTGITTWARHVAGDPVSSHGQQYCLALGCLTKQKDKARVLFRALSPHVSQAIWTAKFDTWAWQQWVDRLLQTS